MEKQKLAEISKEIISFNWAQFNGPKYYDPESVAPAILSLLDLSDSEQIEGVRRTLVSAIGNDHAGTFYPVVLVALDFIIQIERISENEFRKECAGGILCDFYYFRPDIEGFENCSQIEIQQLVKEKLVSYAE